MFNHLIRIQKPKANIEELQRNIFVFRDVNNPFQIIDGTYIYINTHTHIHIYYAENLGNIINHFDLVDICRTLHQTRIQYTFFSSKLKITHILGHKACLSKCK